MMKLLAGWIGAGVVVVLVALVRGWRKGRFVGVPARDYWMLFVLVLLWPLLAVEGWRAFRRGSRDERKAWR